MPIALENTRRGKGFRQLGAAVDFALVQQLVDEFLRRKVRRIELASVPERRLNNTLRGFKLLPLRLPAA